MNGNDIMKAMNRLDESYLSEAANNERITIKRGGLGKHAAKLAVGIAAAAVLAIPAGAYAYNHFIHHDNVEHYIKNADELEGRDLVVNAQTEDDELRFTVDTFLCDGHQAFGVLTAERIGEKAGEFLSVHSYSATVVYADNGEYITNNLGGSIFFDGTEKPGQLRQTISIDLSGVDTDRGIKLLFREKEPGDDLYGNGKLTGQKDKNNIPIRYNCDLVISAEPNVGFAKLYDSEGNEITLSEFEIYSDTVLWEDTVSIFDTFRLIDKNGERHSFEGAEECGYMETYSFIRFDELINVDEYIGVEIDGVEYLKR